MLFIFLFEDFAHHLNLLGSGFIFFYKAYKTSQKPLVCVYGIVRVVQYYLCVFYVKYFLIIWSSQSSLKCKAMN